MKVTALINPTAGIVGPDGRLRRVELLESVGICGAVVIVLDPDNAAGQMRGLIERTCDLSIFRGRGGARGCSQGDFGRAMQDASVAVDAERHLQLNSETGASDRLPSGNIIAALVEPSPARAAWM